MSRADMLEGLRSGIPVALASSPFGLLFGALAVDNGLTLSQVTVMSASVYAGASQMVGLELFGHGVPAWVIVLSILAVNFRHILYSAAIARHVSQFTAIQKFFTFFLLVDPQFAESIKRVESGRPLTFAWYVCSGMTVYVLWVTTSLIGGLLGNFIGDPKAIGLDILLPVYFLGNVIGFRKRDNFMPVALVSLIGSVVAFHYVGSPWHVSLGALAGIALAALLPPVKSNRKPDIANETHEV